MNILIKVEAYALAVVMLPFILSIILCVANRMWIQLKIFGLIGAAIFAILVVSVAIQIWIDEINALL